MKKKVIYRQLVDRYFSGTASVEEVEVFFRLLGEGELEAFLPGEKPKTRWPWYAAAASVLLVAAAALLWRKTPQPPVRTATVNQFLNDKSPGAFRATLATTSAPAQRLDSGRIGARLQPGGTVTTPASGEFNITLKDGTRIWLNALSSVHVPNDFNQTDRTIDITGEAYLEVARDPKRPFHVHVRGEDIQVLGTDFNVNAYPDEPAVRTTLIKGAVRLTNQKDTLLLKPGETAQDLTLTNATGKDQATAWKNGYFSFDGADLQTVMRQIARWYGVDIKYQTPPGNELFGGQIGRDLNLSEVLDGLSKSNLHFRLEGNVLTVLN